MKRGDVWWAQLPAPVGRRPVVLVSRDEAYRVRELVIVVPLTTRRRDIPVEVPLGREEGLAKRCVANADTVTTIPQKMLVEYAGTLSGAKMDSLDAALRFALDLD